MHMRILGMGPNWIRNWNLSWTWTAWLWTVIMQLVIGPWMTVFLALFCSVHKNSLPVSSEGIKCLLSLLVSCATEVENQVCICDELHMLGSIVQKLVRCILAFFRPSIHVVFIFCIWNQEGVVRPCSTQYEVKGFCMCVAIPVLFQYGQLAKQPRHVLVCMESRQTLNQKAYFVGRACCYMPNHASLCFTCSDSVHTNAIEIVPV